MKSQMLFWFVWILLDGKPVPMAVAAMSERSVRAQVRRRYGKAATVKSMSAIAYAHAWVLDLGK